MPVVTRSQSRAWREARLKEYKKNFSNIIELKDFNFKAYRKLYRDIVAGKKDTDDTIREGDIYYYWDEEDYKYYGLLVTKKTYGTRKKDAIPAYVVDDGRGYILLPRYMHGMYTYDPCGTFSVLYCT